MAVGIIIFIKQSPTAVLLKLSLGKDQVFKISNPLWTDTFAKYKITLVAIMTMSDCSKTC